MSSRQISEHAQYHFSFKPPNFIVTLKLSLGWFKSGSLLEKNPEIKGEAIQTLLTCDGEPRIRTRDLRGVGQVP